MVCFYFFYFFHIHMDFPDKLLIIENVNKIIYGFYIEFLRVRRAAWNSVIIFLHLEGGQKNFILSSNCNLLYENRVCARQLKMRQLVILVCEETCIFENRYLFLGDFCRNARSI